MISLDASLAGIQRAEASLDKSASRLSNASAPGSDVDTASEIVGMTAAKNDLSANVAVARSVSKTIGTLIDMFA